MLVLVILQNMAEEQAFSLSPMYSGRPRMRGQNVVRQWVTKVNEAALWDFIYSVTTRILLRTQDGLQLSTQSRRLWPPSSSGLFRRQNKASGCEIGGLRAITRSYGVGGQYTSTACQVAPHSGTYGPSMERTSDSFSKRLFPRIRGRSSW